MPADFGDIAAYHHEEAARHYALAQAKSCHLERSTAESKDLWLLLHLLFSMAD
jgi:hypothetical protein